MKVFYNIDKIEYNECEFYCIIYIITRFSSISFIGTNGNIVF